MCEDNEVPEVEELPLDNRVEEELERVRLVHPEVSEVDDEC